MYLAKIYNKSGSGAAAPKDPNVIIIATRSIIGWPQRDSKKVKMNGNFTFTENPKIAVVYMTSSKISTPYENAGEEDSISVKHKFEGERPGDELDTNEFIADWLNEPCIIIHGSCQDKYRKVVGTKCAPVQLKPTGQNNNDARKHMLAFEQFASTEWLPGHFTGSVDFSTPTAVADAGAITINEAGGAVYQLPSHAITEAIVFDTITADAGTVITLIGGGGVAAATLSTGVADKSAILVNGTDWVALAGAIIHLEVFKAGATTFLIEKSREE
ncbi:MAG: hypothetical protein B7Y83_00210 [Flavobacteriales bacterium 32-34-25]|nr:MAG: hypothetical protein B7Y83_00210 [Flavobacteriales bacterium 32-34-25]